MAQAASILQDDLSVVLLGSFNPSIFSPTWFALNGLISKEQGDGASNVSIIVHEIAQFTAAFMSFDIQPQRFLVRGRHEYGDLVKDLVIGTFGDLLPHTPIWTLGLNRSFKFECSSPEKRLEIGRAIAPPTAWGAWGDEIASGMHPGQHHGGVTRVTMVQSPRPDGYAGHIQADIYPEAKDEVGLYMDVNHHFIIGAADKTVGSAAALAVISDNWLISLDKSMEIFKGFLGEYGE